MPTSTSVLLPFLLCAIVGLAQESVPKPISNSTPGQERLDDLLDRLSSLPPEYKADLGFTILDYAATSISSAQQQSLLDDIFHSATRSRYPYRLSEASSHSLTAYLLGNSELDGLEVQAHAVDRALPLTPQFAKHLFEEVKLTQDRASCQDVVVEDVSAFYVTAAKIIEDPRIATVFDDNKESYLLNLVTNMRIPAQIAPLADLISGVPLTSDQLGQIEGAFVSSLSRITASDREMTAAEQGGNLTEAIKLLSVKFVQSGVHPGRLLSAYRSFLFRSLTPERCAD